MHALTIQLMYPANLIRTPSDETDEQTKTYNQTHERTHKQIEKGWGPVRDHVVNKKLRWNWKTQK